MGILEDINSGKYNTILFGILFIFMFHQYWNSKTELMADVVASDQIKDAIRQVYLIDIDAIRNLSNIATKLQTDGLTIPGNLTVTGNVSIANELSVGTNVNVGIKDKTDGTLNVINKTGNPGVSNLILKGTIVAWFGSVAPTGWALCDGQNGTPDLRGRFVLGSGKVDGLTERKLNDKGGVENVKLTVGNMPSHTHKYNDSYHSERGGNDPDYIQNNMLGSGDTDNDNRPYILPKTTKSEGGDQPFNIMPPFYALAYIIKL